MPDGSSAPTGESEARIPPHSLDAEAAVLSAVLLEPQRLSGLLGRLEPEHFYADCNRRIYEAILTLSNGGTPVDIVTVATDLQRTGTLGRVGGQTYLAMVADATPCVSNIQAHAAIVRECWRRRVLIRVFAQVQAELYAGLGADEAWRRVREECAT